MWTTISSLGILAVTIHFIKDDWQFDHFVLDVLYISSPHTALAIKDSIIKIVSELNIADRLIGITSNNEAKMLAVTRLIKEDLNLSEFCHYHCAAHISNLAVEAALNTSIVPNCVKKLRIFISTPNEEEWNILTILADLLAPFASVTRVISASSYPTIGEVKLLFKGIRMHLNQSRGENFILQDQVDEMNRVFTNYFDEISETLHVPAFFNSRYKKLAYGDMFQNNIFEPICRVIANYRESNNTHIPSQPIQASQRHLMNLSAIETRNFFRNLIALNQTPQPVLNELELYFTSNSPGDEVVPLE
ncbi:zinc finger BED domain-containing protein RICESLEEPER 2-like [Rhizophagus irregularis DAOM 181602=DAOM 197198]|nr:zinc finger BED domain-containing protein RICESLEEPER 2-like [Rhizophagus irregularis DAOM 181602=DAOM 197198]